jgi:flagellar hook protein FlgE
MSGFNTAVNGLKAATTDLDVTGNNIANSSTVGFKSSERNLVIYMLLRLWGRALPMWRVQV